MKGREEVHGRRDTVTRRRVSVVLVELAVRPMAEPAVGIGDDQAAGGLVELTGIEVLEPIDLWLLPDACGGVVLVRPVLEPRVLARDVEAAVPRPGERAG